MKINTLLRIVSIFAAVFFCLQSFVKAEDLPKYFNGITLDAAQLLTADEADLKPEEIAYRNRTIEALNNLPAKTIIRVVFDNNTEASDYKVALNYLRSLKMPDGTRKIFIMGEILDSDYLAQYRWNCGRGCSKGESGEGFHDYRTRVDTYLKDLDLLVDIWEIGNEVNGEWADEGCKKKPDGSCYSDKEPSESGEAEKSKPERDVVGKKIAYAAEQATKKNKPIALTLIHQPECTTWDKNTMFDWAKDHLKARIDKYKINYLLISYYEDNCDNGEQTIEPETSLSPRERQDLTRSEKEKRRRELYWIKTFTRLQTTFSKVEFVGFGEVGYSSDMKTCPQDVLSFCKNGAGEPAGSKISLLNRYYGMKLDDSKYKYIGGHFWWTAQEDITYGQFYSEMTKCFK